MGDPTAPDRSHRRGLMFVLCLVVASSGTTIVWRLATYIESLTVLARTDRAAAAALFKSRVLPAVGAIALISVVAGMLLARQGVIALRSARQAEDDGAGVDDIDPEQRGARLVGLLFISAGVLMALVPLALFGVTVWTVW
ncbi:MAG: hypothetical protein ABIX28_11320 [Vicinamibacterales bacterium]